MNCGPNELVRYVGKEKHLLGKQGWIGRTLKLICGSRGQPAWIVEPPIDEAWNGDWIEDNSLRPIRPGESPEESIEAMRLLTEIPKEIVHE